MNLQQLLQTRPFPIDPPPQFVCPRCLAASWHPCDRRYGYCGRCHEVTGVPDPNARCTA
jgi:hypothetical protein